AEVARMKASGEVKFPSPREQLPERWWLVELPYDTPHGCKLSIETDDIWNPIDPIGINCCERLSPPVIMYAPGDPRPDETNAGKAARWLAVKLKEDPKTKKKTYKEECMRLFNITSN